jgi:hypothetical protein
LWVEGTIEEHWGSRDPEAAVNAVIDIVYGADAG